VFTVYIIDGFTNPAPLTNNVRQKQQIAQALLQRSEGQLLDALKDNANVKDNRLNCYKEILKVICIPGAA